jgi:serine/threonine protein phosphatase PrpC
LSKQYSYYAIFDGHAGVDAASYSSAHLHHNLVKSQAFLDGDISGAFKEAFSLTDLHYLERSAREGKKSGSTALCALLEEKSKLYIAWLGDSQAVLVKNGKPLDIMIPHKPEREEERKRIEDLGGFVAYVDTWRVNGTLAVSRAIGDPEHKPYISSEPDVTEITLDSDDDFLILACDGLWDQLTPEEATTLVYQYICENETENTQEIAENVASYLSKIAKEEGSSDNITTIVLFFKDLSQLMATPFTPLSPRDRSLTSEMQQNGQFNGINSSHFQFSDSQYEYMQSTANPFDSNSTNSMTWNTPSPFDDIMNNAKLNIEVSESINSQNTNDSNNMSNPFNELTQQTPNNNIDITYENIVDRNVESSELNIESVESLSREQHINPFDTTDKLSNYSNESQLQSLIDNSNARAVQTTDSGSIYSNISDFSASFPFSQTGINPLDPALCSTPLQTTQSLVVDSFDPIIQENIDSQTIMDYTTDERDLCGLGFRQSSQSNIDGLQYVESKDDVNIVSKEPHLDNQTNERNQTQNYSFNNSEIEENSLLETTQWQTAESAPSFLNNGITIADKNNERSTCLLEEYNNDVTQVVESQEQSFVAFNQNQEFQDISSGNESVDSIVYENVNTNSDLVTEMNDNIIENKENNGQLLENKENVTLKTEEHSLLENIEPNFADISSESIESKPEQYSMFENMVSKPEFDSSQFVDSNLEKYPNLDNQELTPKDESQNFEPEVKEDLFAENYVKMDTKQNEFSSMGKVETNSSEMVSNSMELKAEDSSMSLTIETDSKESSFKTNESKTEEYMLLENEVSNTRSDDDLKAEEILLLANMVVNSSENITASEVSKLEESLRSDFAESKAPEISSADVEQKPNESLKSENKESKSTEKSTKKLDSKQKDSIKSMNIESKPKDKSSAPSSAPLKTSKAVPSKTLNKTSTLLSKSSKTTTTTNKTLANTNVKPLSPEKVATKQPLVGVRPKTTPTTASTGPSRPTAKTTSTSAPKASDTSKPSRPLVSRVSGSRLTPATASTSAAAKPLTSAPKPLAAKASDTKVSSSKVLPTKTSTVSRTTATTSTTSKTLSTTKTASSALTGKTPATNVSSLSRKPTTQTTSATNLRPKTTSTITTTKVGAVNGKPVSTKPQTSTLKSVTSKIDSGKSLTASNKTTATNRLAVKSSTGPTKPGVKPIPIKGENKVSAVTKTIPTTSNGLSSKTVNKHNNPLNVPKPLKQELEDADLLSQPTGYSSIETKRSDNMSPMNSEAIFSSPDTAEKAFIMSKNGSLDMTCISNTSGFEISTNNINDSNLNSRDHNSDHNSNSLLL